MFGRKIEMKTDAQIRTMRAAGLITARALAAAREAAVPGATTAQVDAAAAAVIEEAGATPNFLGYSGFPAVSCISVNDEAVHGIPGDRVLAAGDLVTVDCGCIVDGWHSDSALTFPVGGESAAAAADVRLSRVTERALWAGIAAFATASRVGEIGEAIDDFVSAEAPDLGILEDYVGHGIGSAMHQAPDVLNYRSQHAGARIKPGMCLAIEPMLVTGGIGTHVLGDGWTVVTDDGGRAAQWEHTVARHAGGIWVLTAPDGGAAELARFGVQPVPLED